MTTPDVTAGALLQCDMGSVPGALLVSPINRVTAGGTPSATTMDNVPLLNIPSFGMCRSVANPVVATATSAALGALTPMPCVPLPAAPWTPGTPTVTIASLPALDTGCRLSCAWAGSISVLQPAQITVVVP